MFLKRFFLFLKSFDWSLFFIIFILLAINLAIQYTLSLGPEKNDFSFFTRQLAFSILGLILFFLFSFIDYRAYRAYANIFYIVILILLALVLVIGLTYRGTKGWIGIGNYNFQVIELGKIALVILLAKFWSVKIKSGIRIKEIFLSFIILLPAFILVLLQPDFGSFFVLFSIWFLILLIIDRKIKHFAWIFILGVVVFISMWFFVLKDYQKDRLLVYLNPERDPFYRGYQITQSIIAVGSGKFLGRGLGLGPQSQLRFLPQTKTDFVFSVIAEELGLAGIFLILILYFILFYRLVKMAKSAYDDFSLILILGFASIFLIQIIINIGMNIGLIPIVGIPLPLLSYGGSSLVSSLIIFGILQSILLHKTF